MNFRQSWKQWLAAGVLTGAVVTSAFAIFPQTTLAQSDSDTETPTTEQAAPAAPWGRGGMAFGLRGFGGELRGEYQTYLADALGITVEELQAAQQTAQNAMIDQAVADGALTQEQADLMKARHAFMQYFAGQAQQSVEDALNAAVEAGAITQEQADLLLENLGQMGRGMFGEGFGGRGGRGNFHHRGMMPGDENQMPGRGYRMMPGNQAPTPTPEANS